jgi:hypothetical protein
MREGWIGFAAVAAWLLCAGCGSTLADPLGRENSLEEAQRRYTQLVRWGDIEKASAYVDPELHEAFLAHGPQLELLRFTDFEVGSIEYGDDDSATVTVTYRAYSETTFVERSIREEQQWHREGGLANTWRVRSELPALLAGLKGEPTP